MDIYTVVKQDYKQIVTLLTNLSNLNDVQNLYTYFNQLSQELDSHIKTKEQVFYPVVRQNYPNGKELIAKAEVEHQTFQQLLEDLESFSPTSDEFKQKAVELQQAIQAFFQQEEDDILLPTKLHLDDIQRQQLGNEYLAAKK